MTIVNIVTDYPLVRFSALVVIGLFSIWMMRSMFESWRRLGTLRRHRLEETYDIARLVFGLITAGLIFWLLLTPPPHQLTHGLMVAFGFWACAYLALFGLLIFVRKQKR